MSTKIADVIVPEVFNPYVAQRTMELSALVQAGIISSGPELDALARSGGSVVNMPYWNDLTGDDEVLSDTTPLTPSKITAGQDAAVLLMRGKAWGVNDLAKALSGDDPMKRIGDLVAAYWARKQQVVLLKTLEGVFGAASMAGNLLDISALTGGAEKISGSAFIDAKFKLGDAYGGLVAVAMHSTVYAALQKADLIAFIKPSEDVSIPTYQGLRVIVDDGLPVSTGTFTSYLFGAGAIGFGNGAAPVPTETDRDSLAGEDILINRTHYLLHPRGVKWTGASLAGAAPTNAELATAANWLRVYENKAIRIVAFKHKV